MKKLMIVLIVLMMVNVATANIFGGQKEFSAVFGKDYSVVQYHFAPIPELSHGPVVEFQLDPVEEHHQRVKKAFLGYGINYSVAAVNSLIEPLPIEGKTYVFGRFLWDTSTSNELFVSYGPGVDILVHKGDSYDVNTRIEYRIMDGNPSIDDFKLVTFGCAVRY